MGQGKFGIGEVTQRLGVTPKQLHDWEKSGLIEAHMTATGREFDEEMLLRIEFIRDDLEEQRKHGKPTLEKTKEKLQLQSMLVEKKEEQNLQMDKTITNSLEKVFRDLGMVEVIEKMGQAYNQVAEKLDGISEELKQTREENRQLRELVQQLSEKTEKQQGIAAAKEAKDEERHHEVTEKLISLREAREEEKKKKKFFGLF